LLKLNVFVLCSSKVFCTYSTEQSEGVHFLSIRQSKYSAILSKVHSYRLLFWRFCPLVFHVQPANLWFWCFFETS